MISQLPVLEVQSVPEISTQMSTLALASKAVHEKTALLKSVDRSWRHLVAQIVVKARFGQEKNRDVEVGEVRGIEIGLEMQGERR